jgi:hypothetical protein
MVILKEEVHDVRKLNGYLEIVMEIEIPEAELFS